jgi:hypothetical protein
VGSFTVNLPVYYWFYAQSDQDFLQSVQNLTNLPAFTYCGRTNFLESKIGLISSAISILLRDILTLVLEVSTNILLMIFLKRFIENKSSVVANNIPYDNTNPIEDSSLTNGNNNHHHSLNILNKIAQKRKKMEMKKIERNIKMTISLSIISIMSHMLTFTIFVIGAIILIRGTKSPVIYSFLNILTIVIRYSSNYFIYYSFNTNFKEVANNFLKRNHDNQNVSNNQP